MTHQPSATTTSARVSRRAPWPGLSVAAVVLSGLALVAAGYSMIAAVPDTVGFERLAAFVYGVLPASALWLASAGFWLGGRVVAHRRGDRPPRAVPVLVAVTFVVVVAAWLLLRIVSRTPA